MSEIRCASPLLCNCPNCYAVIVIRRSLELKRLQDIRRRGKIAGCALSIIVFTLTYIALLSIHG